MEPLKPEEKRRLLQNNPSISSEDIEEYEKLLAERFTTDPNIPTTTSRAKMTPSVSTGTRTLTASPVLSLSPEEQREARLKILYRKIYHPETSP